MEWPLCSWGLRCFWNPTYFCLGPDTATVSCHTARGVHWSLPYKMFTLASLHRLWRTVHHCFPWDAPLCALKPYLLQDMFGIPCPSAVKGDTFEHKSYYFKEQPKNLPSVIHLATVQESKCPWCVQGAQGWDFHQVAPPKPLNESPIKGVSSAAKPIKMSVRFLSRS